MSERYGACPSCQGFGYYRFDDPVLMRKKGDECGACEGTGLSGDVTLYLKAEKEKENDHR